MIIKWNIVIPELSDTLSRNGYVFLPEDYKEHPEHRYPVLYMFDGHNVFFDSDAAFGKSWGMNDYLLREKLQLIVVAVACNPVGNGRLEEYAPFDFTVPELGSIVSKGKAYMEWLVGTLKPYIDENYPTIPDREHTIICGSSMGGLMSLYAACAYNHVFQRAACLSPSVWVDPGEVMRMVAHAGIQNDTCIYVDYGSGEIYNHGATVEALASLCHLLLTKHVNLAFRIVPGGTHCEASWEKQIPIFMECLHLK